MHKKRKSEHQMTVCTSNPRIRVYVCKVSFTNELNREELVWIEKLNVNCACSGPESKWLNLTKLIKNRKLNKKIKPIPLPLSLPRQQHSVAQIRPTSGTCGLHVDQMWAGSGPTLCCCQGMLYYSWQLSTRKKNLYSCYFVLKYFLIQKKCCITVMKI